MINLVKLLTIILSPRNKEEFAVSKEVMPVLPPVFHSTLLGFGQGSKRQYRNDEGGHVREYEERFVYHKDEFNPEKHPVKHLFYDTQLLQTLFVFGALSFVYRKYNCRSKKG
ncbi:MAG: hypothetical protein QXX17_03925 [Conexivisphaerales archaeon]